MLIARWVPTVLLVACAESAFGFAPLSSQGQPSRHDHLLSCQFRQFSPLHSTVLFLSSSDKLDDQDWDSWNPKLEQSQMPDFITSFLDKNRSQDSKNSIPIKNRHTHMIGVPMDDCHELLLELESVQRAILYHCPVLVHACIVPAVTRMPLLYVEASDKTVATVTKTLHDLVQKLVQKHFYSRESEATDDAADRTTNGDEVLEGVNGEGYRPLVMSFHNLEIDGKANEVLHTVAMDDTGSQQLTSYVHELKHEIEALGWKTSFPPDDHAENTFRPRVPFMRLPSNFESYLDPMPSGQEEWMRTSDQGGNGISPIFWCQWWEDVMGRSVRLREIGVYPRQPGILGISEQAFYIPHESIPLPNGNDALTKVEARHRAYNEQRMAEAEGLDIDKDDLSDDGKDPGLQEQRKRFETLYASPEAVDATEIDDDVKEEIEETLKNLDGIGTTDKQTQTMIDDTADRTDTSQLKLDEWMMERIRKTVDARASIKARTMETKDMPDIEENAVFQKYKDGTLVDKTVSSKAVAPKRELPPYPSREHFIGIWRVVSSPTGFPEEVGDDTKSDNLVLRVDGTTAGGPTLDREMNQKASGGTWKLVDATDDDGTKLRIRLVIPPKKERILVMEGEVTRFTTPTDLPLTSSTFGIPQVEIAAQRAAGEMDDLMHCGGQVWIEDAVTGKNRDEIGTFSLMKLQSPLDPSQYTITIPRPVRSQD